MKYPEEENHRDRMQNGGFWERGKQGSGCRVDAGLSLRMLTTFRSSVEVVVVQHGNVLNVGGLDNYRG